MYYLKIKCGFDPYELDDCLEFYFNHIEDLFDFQKQIFKVSNYEMIIGKCEDENE